MEELNKFRQQIEIIQATVKTNPESAGELRTFQVWTVNVLFYFTDKLKKQKTKGHEL